MVQNGDVGGKALEVSCMIRHVLQWNFDLHSHEVVKDVNSCRCSRVWWACLEYLLYGHFLLNYVMSDAREPQLSHVISWGSGSEVNRSRCSMICTFYRTCMWYIIIETSHKGQAIHLISSTCTLSLLISSNIEQHPETDSSRLLKGVSLFGSTTSGKVQSGDYESCLESKLAVQMSKRIRATDDPIMVQSSRIVGGVKNPHNLGQGDSQSFFLR